jgi:hypothetical protein
MMTGTIKRNDTMTVFSILLRFSSVHCNRNETEIMGGRFSLISERAQQTRMRRVSSFNPGDPQNTVKKIQEFNADDGYNNPGRFMTEPNLWGRNVLLFTDRGRSLFLTGSGASPEGDRPFIDKYEVAKGKTARLWRSEAPYYETVVPA